MRRSAVAPPAGLPGLCLPGLCLPGLGLPGLALLAPLLLAALLAAPARGQELTADVSNHLVAITTGFSGTSILIFGALTEPGEVVVAVRGPAHAVKLYRQSPVLGVWVNSASRSFPQVPSFYALASSGPLEEIATEAERERLQLGLNELVLRAAGRASPNLQDEWRQALIRAKVRDGLYQIDVAPIRLMNDQLFRVSFDLPTNVPVGTYLVDVFVLRDGIAVAAQSIPLVVSKVGFEANLYNFAHNQSALYGLAAIAVALLAGWIAHLLFRRN